MNLLVAPDTLESRELTDGKKIGVDKDVHDGPVAFTTLLRIVREIDRQGDTVHVAEAPQMLKPTMFSKKTQGVVVPREDVSAETDVHEKSLITLA